MGWVQLVAGVRGVLCVTWSLLPGWCFGFDQLLLLFGLVGGDCCYVTYSVLRLRALDILFVSCPTIQTANQP